MGVAWSMRVVLEFCDSIAVIELGSAYHLIIQENNNNTHIVSPPTLLNEEHSEYFILRHEFC